MKIYVWFKTPDAVYNAVCSSLYQQYGKAYFSKEIQDIIENLVKEVSNQLSKWVKQGEYIKIEFDTEANTATVLEHK
jgi:hypothetical protein